MTVNNKHMSKDAVDLTLDVNKIVSFYLFFHTYLIFKILSFVTYC